MMPNPHPTGSDRRLAAETDSGLLSKFAMQRDQDAFAELVRRHCGLVLGVCRRVLRNSHDVEDVFQATFLVLARDIDRIRKRASLANWLYSVAYRLALLVARRQRRRRETELTEPSTMLPHDLLDDMVERHDQQLVDEELHTLPERYRRPLVLHYLAGRTHQEVAEELGLTTDAVDGLLKRGRKQLREQLMRRGVAIGAALAAVQASQQADAAALGDGLINPTVQAGIAFTSKSPPAGAVSLRAAELAGKELATMSMTSKTVLAAGIILGTSTVIGGFGLAISLAAARPQPAGKSPDNPAPRSAPQDGVRTAPLVADQVIPDSPRQAAPEQPNLLAQNSRPDAAAGKYTNADEAYAIGAAFYNARNFAASEEPFEAALKLAPDDKYRIKVYRALLGAYRQLAEIDKFVDAADFIITKSESAPERSIIRTDLLSFVHQRGKTNDLAQRYEKVLDKDDKNVTALYVLSELYADLKRDPKRSAELLERLAKVSADGGQALNVPASAKLAQQYVRQGKFAEGASLFEKIAPLDTSLAAWHWKEAAQAWMKARNKSKALAAAKAAVAAGPEKRGDLLLHFWHRGLGQVFLETGEPAAAIEQLEAAIKSTKIDGYIQGCQAELATAKEQLARIGK